MESKLAFCGGCNRSELHELDCVGAFDRAGIKKVHWECWTDCSLSCKFCYRTKHEPLDFHDSKLLLRAIKTSGAKWITFAGGDPSLRIDLNELLSFSRDIGLQVEIQTNAQVRTDKFLETVLKSDQVGLSLDGPSAETHDTFRSKKGNFNKVLATLETLNCAKIPTLVRSVVSKQNSERIEDLSLVINQFDCVKRWSLLQFTPLGEGLANKKFYEIPDKDFEAAVDKCRQLTLERIEVDGFSNSRKAGVYALVSPSGQLYGTASNRNGLYHNFVGSFLTDHVKDLCRRLPFDQQRHSERYGE